jgi:protein-S-isoprenylcysteine O-methyltransferase Ste14
MTGRTFLVTGASKGISRGWRKAARPAEGFGSVSAAVAWWGLATISILAIVLGIRIGIKEKTLRMGLDGYDDYARRVHWRLIPSHGETSPLDRAT